MNSKGKCKCKRFVPRELYFHQHRHHNLHRHHRHHHHHRQENIIAYIEELLPLLEHSDFIHRYSWFRLSSSSKLKHHPRYSGKEIQKTAQVLHPVLWHARGWIQLVLDWSGELFAGATSSQVKYFNIKIYMQKTWNQETTSYKDVLRHGFLSESAAFFMDSILFVSCVIFILFFARCTFVCLLKWILLFLHCGWVVVHWNMELLSEQSYINPCRKSAVGEAYDHPWHLDIYKPNSTDFWEEKSPVSGHQCSILAIYIQLKMSLNTFIFVAIPSSGQCTRHE